MVALERCDIFFRFNTMFLQYYTRGAIIKLNGNGFVELRIFVSLWAQEMDFCGSKKFDVHLPLTSFSLFPMHTIP